MKPKEAAAAAEISVPTLNRIENGRQGIKPSIVKLLCHAYEVDRQRMDTLLQLARDSNQRGWWTAYSDTLDDWFARYVGEESEASEICVYTPELVDGLLQTPEYALAVVGVFRPKISQEEIDRTIRLRRARQAGLDGEEAPQLKVVLNEAVVRRAPDDRAVMREQLRHLIAMTERPNITIQVLPFEAGLHPGMRGPFNLLRFPKEYDMDTVYLEHELGALYQEKPEATKYYSDLFARLAHVALPPKESAMLLDSLTAHL
jgi:transcriptional regulator with XRE-family HTH domain